MLDSVKSKVNYFIQVNLFFFVKRLVDICISLLLLIILLPLFLVICLWIMRKEGKPIFNRELRAGKDDQPFVLWSFRTMTNGSRVIRQLPPYPFPKSWEKGVPDYFKIKLDKYKTYTETGLTLKKYRLDKLPLLINVLKGDMSFIGPSPERLEIADYYNQQQLERLKVRPGLTGYAQIKGATNDNHGQKIKYDLYYVQNCSYKLDLKIFFQTVKLLFKKNSESRARAF